ncbi:MAG: hypothetical protein OJF51_001145 [Nitrospira sp.]|nr:MAG: hypothetical protein OJF51_001145 [Nitrospira sp.]
MVAGAGSIGRLHADNGLRATALDEDLHQTGGSRRYHPR